MKTHGQAPIIADDEFWTILEIGARLCRPDQPQRVEMPNEIRFIPTHRQANIPRLVCDTAAPQVTLSWQDQSTLILNEGKAAFNFASINNPQETNEP